MDKGDNMLLTHLHLKKQKKLTLTHSQDTLELTLMSLCFCLTQHTKNNKRTS